MRDPERNWHAELWSNAVRPTMCEREDVISEVVEPPRGPIVQKHVPSIAESPPSYLAHMREAELTPSEFGFQRLWGPEILDPKNMY